MGVPFNSLPASAGIAATDLVATSKSPHSGNTSLKATITQLMTYINANAQIAISQVTGLETRTKPVVGIIGGDGTGTAVSSGSATRIQLQIPFISTAVTINTGANTEIITTTSDLYLLWCSVAWEANAVGSRSILFYKDGSHAWTDKRAATAGTNYTAFCFVDLVAPGTTTFSVYAEQDSGSSLEINSDASPTYNAGFFGIARISQVLA